MGSDITGTSIMKERRNLSLIEKAWLISKREAETSHEARVAKNDKITTAGKKLFKVCIQIKNTLNGGEKFYFRTPHIRRRKDD